jgi:C-terminal processing protease CtpA/Prc
VLIGPVTNSAGEGVALAFRGRTATRLFGQPTYGRTTGNDPLTLPDGSGLAVAVVVMADRTGRTYGGKIEPDEPVDWVANAPLESDSAVRRRGRGLWKPQGVNRAEPAFELRPGPPPAAVTGPNSIDEVFLLTG